MGENGMEATWSNAATSDMPTGTIESLRGLREAMLRAEATMAPLVGVGQIIVRHRPTWDKLIAEIESHVPLWKEPAERILFCGLPMILAESAYVYAQAMLDASRSGFKSLVIDEHEATVREPWPKLGMCLACNQQPSPAP